MEGKKRKGNGKSVKEIKGKRNEEKEGGREGG